MSAGRQEHHIARTAGNVTEIGADRHRWSRLIGTSLGDRLESAGVSLDELMRRNPAADPESAAREFLDNLEGDAAERHERARWTRPGERYKWAWAQDVSASELLVLLVLCETWSRSERASLLSAAGIARKAKLSKAQVKRALRRLERVGLIVVVRRLGNRGHSASLRCPQFRRAGGDDA